MYKLKIGRYGPDWFWDLRQANDFIVVLGNIGYSTKSNARRAFWQTFNEKTIKKIVEEKK